MNEQEMDLVAALQQTRDALHQSERGTILVSDNTHVKNGYTILFTSQQVEMERPYSTPWIRAERAKTFYSLPEVQEALRPYCEIDEAIWTPVK